MVAIIRHQPLVKLAVDELQTVNGRISCSAVLSLLTVYSNS